STALTSVSRVLRSTAAWRTDVGAPLAAAAVLVLLARAGVELALLRITSQVATITSRSSYATRPLAHALQNLPSGPGVPPPVREFSARAPRLRLYWCAQGNRKLRAGRQSARRLRWAARD